MDTKHPEASLDQNQKMAEIYRMASEPNGVSAGHLIDLEGAIYALASLNDIEVWPYALIDRDRFNHMVTTTSLFLYMARYSGEIQADRLGKIKPALFDLHTEIHNMDKDSVDRKILEPFILRAANALYCILEDHHDHRVKIQEQEERLASRTYLRLVQ